MNKKTTVGIVGLLITAGVAALIYALIFITPYQPPTSVPSKETGHFDHYIYIIETESFSDGKILKDVIVQSDNFFLKVSEYRTDGFGVEVKDSGNNCKIALNENKLITTKYKSGSKCKVIDQVKMDDYLLLRDKALTVQASKQRINQ